jgi:hypothetical protein
MMDKGFSEYEIWKMCWDILARKPEGKHILNS